MIPQTFPTFLVLILAIPVVGFLVVLLTPRKNEDFIRWTAAVFSVITFIV